MTRILLWSFFLFACVFVSTISVQPYPGSVAVKAIPALSLAILCLSRIRGIRGRLLFLAFLLCAAGDATLSLASGRHFIAGLVLFLLAQATFIATFALDFKPRKEAVPIVVTLIAYAIIMGAALRPFLRDMALPVYAYLCVITTMGVMAALRALPNKRATAGALLFIASDSLIAVNKFAVPVPAADYLIMVTYYIALFLIASEFIEEMRDHFPLTGETDFSKN